MTNIRKSAFIFFLFVFSVAIGQDKIPLREYLSNLEAQFPCNFSFKDSDVEHHIIPPETHTNLDDALGFLDNNTLFNFSLLQDRTIALQLKQDLLSGCMTITLEGNQTIKNVTLTTPYQKITNFTDSPISFKLKNRLEPLDLNSPGYESMSSTGEVFLNEPCQEQLLFQKIEYLKEVTLTNYFAKGISKNENGSLTVDYKEFDILPGLIEPDVLLTLQALPGIQSVNETVSFLNIRGGTNDQNLILWDGIKMYQNSHFFGLISAFNPLLTEEVDLVKNGTSAQYGDGVSGMISMHGNNEITEKLTAGAGVNLISADAFADVPLFKIASMQVSARKSINNIVRTPTYNSYFDKAFQNSEFTSMDDIQRSNDDFSFFDTSLRLQVKPTEKDYLRANLLVMANSLEFLENAELGSSSQSLKSDLVQNNISAGVYYKRNWNDKFTSDLQFYGSSYMLQSRNQDILNNQRLFQENNVLESGLTVKNEYSFSNKLTATLGYQFNETGITNFEQINNPFFERSDKEVIRTNSGFAEAHYRPLPSTYINVGVRANHFDKFNEVMIEPRLSMSHQFLDFFTFEILGELKSQTTSQVIDFQNDFLGVENRRWILANPESIPIITSKQLSAGISLNRKGWLVSAEPYIKEVEGVTSQSQGFQNQFIDVRTHGSYTVHGVDFLVNKRFKQVNTWLSYSYAQNDYTFEELTPTEFLNNNDIRHTISYGINYSFGDFNISGGFNWHAGKPNTPLVMGNEIIDGILNFEAPNSSNIKDYLRVDLSGTYSFSLGEKVTAFTGISIWNLLDTENVVNQFYRIDSENNVEQVNEIALGFTPNMTFRVQF